MIGQTVSHYRILEELGGGGMGVVYKAEDTKLKRTVALKFLSPDLTRDKDAKTRFIHEAQAASALQHHNICTIHEIDETDDGRLFIAMDCYEGETLKERIATGPLPVDEAIDIASQAAEGLAKAHEAGMVHRDIKPANIMITRDGVVKIVDFGLAKLAGQTKVTKTGTTVGTVAYMSPEQATGKEIDHRSDIFSSGVVLYEMLAGEVPFKGDHEAAVLYGITHNDPAPLAEYRTEVPEDLQRIVETALRKEPGERYQNALELAADLARYRKGVSTAGYSRDSATRVWLRSLTIAVISILVVIAGYLAYSRFLSPKAEEADAEPIMIAVLPFENLGPADDEYFADGVTEAITTRLAGIRGLGVISRQSAMKYKASGESLKQIGEELGVEYVLEGTIQREQPSNPESRLRVIPQLIRASDDTYIWTETYDEETREIFKVQSDIAERVAIGLDLELREAEEQLLAKSPTDNIEAYEYFLRAREHGWHSQGDMSLAEQLYEKAVELDENFAASWAELGALRIRKFYAFFVSEDLPKAKTAIDKAFLIDPDLPEAHIALGLYHYYGFWEFDEALAQFKIAERLRPSDSEVARWISTIKRRQGKWDEFIDYAKKRIKLGSQSYGEYYTIGQTYVWLRDYSEAERYLNKAITLAPDVQQIYLPKVQLYLSWDENVERAKNVLLEAIQQVDPWFLIGYEDKIVNRVLCGKDERIYARLQEANLGIDSLAYYRSKADLYNCMGDIESSVVYYDSLRMVSERKIASEQQYHPMLHGYLGTAYAGLGRSEKAISEGKRYVKLMPLTKDSCDGFDALQCLAEIYVKVGEYDAAIEQLESLLSIPSDISVGLLKLDPMWDPLRDHPRYQALLEKRSDGDS